jgi:2-amino-4-hydroxy-6-hydroxymethyldihydropteridine diphosphokinase
MLAAAATVRRLSRVYETRPMYVEDQPAYLNAVGELETTLGPRALLDELHRIEAALGRDRSREIRMGARTLDLDILLYGTEVMDSPDLVVPHPRLSERAFVLVPLLELWPDAVHPRTGQRLADALAALDASTGGPAGRGVYLSTGG